MHSCGVVTLTIGKMSDKEEDKKRLDPEVEEEEEEEEEESEEEEDEGGDTNLEIDDSPGCMDDINITDEGGKVNGVHPDYYDWIACKQLITILVCYIEHHMYTVVPAIARSILSLQVAHIGPSTACMHRYMYKLS